MRSDREIDAGRPVDWGRIADEYDRYRPGPPDSFYESLRASGVGLSGQRFLDLGTGTGAMARRFAASGCRVVGVDISLPSLVQAMQEQSAPREVRMRALRGIGASLPSAQVEGFDRDHDVLLRRIAPERFPLTHRIDAHVFTFA